jgi:hypothetical protein
MQLLSRQQQMFRCFVIQLNGIVRVRVMGPTLPRVARVARAARAARATSDDNYPAYV